jgi:hypothetical protein
MSDVYDGTGMGYGPLQLGDGVGFGAEREAVAVEDDYTGNFLEREESGLVEDVDHPEVKETITISTATGDVFTIVSSDIHVTNYNACDVSFVVKDAKNQRKLIEAMFESMYQGWPLEAWLDEGQYGTLVRRALGSGFTVNTIRKLKDNCTIYMSDEPEP